MLNHPKNKPNMNILQRASAPTPSFFKTLRTIGIILATASGALLAAPVALPATVLAIATYTGVAASILSLVSQLTVNDNTAGTTTNSTTAAADTTTAAKVGT